MDKDCVLVSNPVRMESAPLGQTPLARQESLGYLINHLARVMYRVLGERIGPHGVVPGQFAQLLALYENDGQSVTELALEVAIEHPTMSRTLDRMQRDGLVEARRDPNDGRSRRIYLTEHAREIESAIKAEAAAVNEAFLAPLDPDQGAELVAMLNSIIEAWDERDQAEAT